MINGQMHLDLNNGILVFSPHQDDESLGLAILLQRIRGKRYIVFLTNGAPSTGYPMRKRKISVPLQNPEEYASVRRSEAINAMCLLGISKADLFFLDYVDSDLSFELDACLDDLRDIIQETNPGCILTPSYEGSHPDHDACAILAKALHMEFKNINFYEYALYNYSGTVHNINSFGDTVGETYTVKASPEEAALKESVVACYLSQAGGFVDTFPTDVEMIRCPDFEKINGDKPIDPTFGEKYFGFKSERITEAYAQMKIFSEKNKDILS